MKPRNTSKERVRRFSATLERDRAFTPLEPGKGSIGSQESTRVGAFHGGVVSSGAVDGEVYQEGERRVPVLAKSRKSKLH